MVSDLLFYQLALFVLVWLFVMMHLTWPTQGSTTLPARALPRRRRTNKPTPCAGLTQKPHCARCEQDTTHPKAPSGVPPEPMPYRTSGSSRTKVSGGDQADKLFLPTTH